MPIPYKTTRYGCQHKCGTRRRNTSYKAQMHEAICWKNPALKTCKTCKNEVYEYIDSDEPIDPTDDFLGFYSKPKRSCLDETAAKMIEQEYQTLVNGKNDHIKPIVNCPFWESKNEE